MPIIQAGDFFEELKALANKRFTLLDGGYLIIISKDIPCSTKILDIDSYD